MQNQLNNEATLTVIKGMTDKGSYLEASKDHNSKEIEYFSNFDNNRTDEK